MTRGLIELEVVAQSRQVKEHARWVKKAGEAKDNLKQKKSNYTIKTTL